MKANLVTTEENAEEFPALSDVSSEAVSALQAILKIHRATMKDRGADQVERRAAEGAIVRVTNTLSKVLESARKLQSDGLQAVRNMNFQDRATLFATWYQALPPLYRKKVRGGIEQFEGTVALPVPQLPAGENDEREPQV